jgi:hypothetical protein
VNLINILCELISDRVRTARFGRLCALSVPSAGEAEGHMEALTHILLTLTVATAITVQGPENTSHVERMAKVVSYAKRSGVTSVGMQGTALLPTARGEVRVQQEPGHTEIVAEFDGLKNAAHFGPEYLTYVLWAITPEGCLKNLGEVVLNDEKSTVSATTELEAFSLIVTSEPYFAVSQPSDVVVLDSLVSKDTKKEIAEFNVKYELLPRGNYTANVSPSKVKPLVLEAGTPLDLYEARNALWIALWAGAEENAPHLFAEAERLLQKAEAFQASSTGALSVSTAAREAVQISEKARLLALRHKPESRTD